MSDKRLERAILGALMLKPGLLEGSSLRDIDFPSGLFRDTFSAISSIWENAKSEEIDPIILAERVRSGGNGNITFIASLLDGEIKLHRDIFEERVSELQKHALTTRILAKISSQANTGKLDLEEIRGDLAEYDKIKGKAFNPADVVMTGEQLQAMKIEVEWTLDKLIPSRSLTLLHGPGGLGKTWLALAIAEAVQTGMPFLGLQTIQRPVVFIDYENPLPMLIDRVRQLNILGVSFWHLSASVRPPKLDGPDWAHYKSFPAGSLMIFDTARASHDGEENSDQDAALVMNRLKEIRELGNDILLLYHTTKLNERRARGATTWEDLADHVLAFYKVRRETFEEIEGDDKDPNALLFLGTGRKSRYEPFHLYLTADLSAGHFSIADSPDAEAINAVAEYIAGPGSGQKQGDIITWAKAEGVGPSMRASFLALLNRGESLGRWKSHRGFRGAKIYEPPTCS